MAETGPALRRYRPAVLIVLDGWGRRACTAPGGGPSRCDAIGQARTPNLDRWEAEGPHTLLGASGEDVGLMPGQMGDSNVGHLNLGAGRIVYQDLVRIDRAARDGTIGKVPVVRDLYSSVSERGTTLHLMGLVSDGGVHSHQRHLFALLEAASAAGVADVCVHAFLDGRDVPPKSAAGYLESLEAELARFSAAAPSRRYRIGTLMGRYYAMDRDKRWDRTSLAFVTLVGGGDRSDGQGQGCTGGPPEAASWQGALRAAYERGESDEFVRPVRLLGAAPVRDGDGVLFFNFRADRARQLTRAFIGPLPEVAALGLPADRPAVEFATLTRYDEALHAPAAFEPVLLVNTFGEVVSRAGLRQLRLAETEKYAHVTFFFSGGREEPFPGEDRILVPSPKVATYDLQPEMSAPEITRRAVEAIGSGGYDVVVMNYANCDMVGHTGDFAAAVKAVETVDGLLPAVVGAAAAHGGAVLIVSDHGNAEEMYDEEKACPHTAHTTNHVPAVLVAPGLRPGTGLRPGILADVAPTLLHLLGLAAPPEMTGRTLIVNPEEEGS